MANILTYIELSDNEATVSSLHALNRARDVATDLGATLYALLPCGATPTYDDEDIIAVLSRHGADKVILISHPQLAPPALFATHGEALVSACRQFPPRLVVFPSSAEARDLAPRLAMALRAHYVPDAVITLSGGRRYLSRRVFRRRYEVREPLDALDDPVVTTLRGGQTSEQLGDEEAEVVVVHAPVDPSPRVRLRAPATSLPVEGPAVGGGLGLADKETFARLGRLAAALGGRPAASPSACEAGLADPALRVGLDGAGVESDLYLALGSSGSERHLAGVAPHTELIAVSADPEDAVFAFARHGLVADPRQVLHQLSERLGARGEG